MCGQTWENPGVVDHLTGAKGDNDPIDVVELGSALHARGAVVPVKVVGVIGLIDEGETDWKILAVDVNDPIASQLNGLPIAPFRSLRSSHAALLTLTLLTYHLRNHSFSYLIFHSTERSLFMIIKLNTLRAFSKLKPKLLICVLGPLTLASFA